MNSPSEAPVAHTESVAEQIRRVLLAEVVIAHGVSDDQTTFAPRGTY